MALCIKLVVLEPLSRMALLREKIVTYWEKKKNKGTDVANECA